MHKLLNVLALVSATTYNNHLMVEHKYLLASDSAGNPRMEAAAYNKYVGFSIDDNYEINLTKTHDLSSVSDLSNFFEQDFYLERKKPIVEKDGSLFLKNLTTPVDTVSLLSLFYKKLFEYDEKLKKTTIENITLATRDYFEKPQINSYISVFSNLGYKTKTIPESLAVVLFYLDKINIGEEQKNVYVINFRGTQAIKSTFNCSHKDGKTNVEYIEQQPLDFLSDSKVEMIVAEYLIETIANLDVCYLPYRNDIQGCTQYCDLKPHVLDIIKVLESNLELWQIIDIKLFNILTNHFSVITDIKVPLTPLRNKIKEEFDQLPSNYFLSLFEEEETRDQNNNEEYKHIVLLTDIPFISKLLPKFSSLYNGGHIPEGLSMHLRSSQFSVIDKRIAFDFSNNKSLQFDEITKELTRMKNGLKTILEIPKEIEKLTFVQETEKATFFQKFEKFLKFEGSESLNLKEIGYNVVKDILNGFNELKKINTRLESADRERKYYLGKYETELENCVAIMEELPDEAHKNDLKKHYEEYKEWHENSKENMDISAIDYNKKYYRLKAVVIYYEKMLPKKEVLTPEQEYEKFLENEYAGLPDDLKKDDEAYKKEVYDQYKRFSGMMSGGGKKKAEIPKNLFHAIIRGMKHKDKESIGDLHSTNNEERTSEESEFQDDNVVESPKSEDIQNDSIPETKEEVATDNEKVADNNVPAEDTHEGL